MRLLLTRPQADSEPLAQRLAAAGHGVVVAPVMEIKPIRIALDLTGIQGIAVTSRNGLDAFAALTPSREIPIYAVGPASAAAAEAAGFTHVHKAGGDVNALARLILAACRPEDGALLHAVGSVQAGDLAGALARAGFEVRRAVLYKSRPATALPEAASAALRAGRLDGVLLYSPRTAKLLAELAESAGLAAALSRLTAYCLSQAVAKAAAPSGYHRLAVATVPEEGALLALLQA